MNSVTYQTAFKSLLDALSNVPNVTPEMLEFKGQESDLDDLSYFFYESVLPDETRIGNKQLVDAIRFLIGRILVNDYGFQWENGGVMKNDRRINLSGLIMEADLASEENSIFEKYEETKLQLQKEGIIPWEE